MTTPVATKKKVLFIEYCLIIRCFSIGLRLPLQTYHFFERFTLVTKQENFRTNYVVSQTQLLYLRHNNSEWTLTPLI